MSDQHGMAKIVNRSSMDFVDKWDGKRYEIPAGGELVVPAKVAKFFVGNKDLTDAEEIADEVARVKSRRGPLYNPEVDYVPVNPVRQKKPDLVLKQESIDILPPSIFVGRRGA